ncbi:hypothetical protein MIND_00464700 [Mycena indigotica]|uniref:peptidyl-tRNA hydrolase n=1 Tax=Mycena indigotica TaxID=2126181 RepID=A0A8H6SZH5_9AGAR|nr:uncharacterized protein MIND_00464700 [Mycena indigotica]KAF7306730.1 hypothetical protein MIND_00464700 [Mycena indigotica]
MLLLAIYTAILPAFGLGWYLGGKRQVKHVNNEEGDDSDSESEAGDLWTLDASEDCKMVLVVRTDLGMTTGKIAAQCSHATLACYKTLLSKNAPLLHRWAKAGYVKTVVRCENEDELLIRQAQAQSLNLCARSIQDAGRTQIAAGSTTVLGIAGPGRAIDQVIEGLASWT